MSDDEPEHRLASESGALVSGAPAPGDPVLDGSSSPVLVPAVIERWATAGGTFQVASVGAGSASVDLLRCDGGEIVDSVELTAAEDLRWANVQRELSS